MSSLIRNLVLVAVVVVPIIVATGSGGGPAPGGPPIKTGQPAGSTPFSGADNGNGPGVPGDAFFYSPNATTTACPTAIGNIAPIQAFRTTNGVSNVGLSESGWLDGVAAAHNQDMATKNFVGITSSSNLSAFAQANAPGAPQQYNTVEMLVFVGCTPTGSDKFSDIVNFWGGFAASKAILKIPASPPLSVGINVISSHGVNYATVIFAQ
jgi:hypothetical protein